MEKHIAIIGAGYAGLNLALLLQQHNVSVTLFSNKTAEEIENSQLLNTVARHHATIEKERQLGVGFWDDKALNLSAAEFYVAGEPPLQFLAHLTNPGSFLDTREYTATLMREFARRGGEVVIRDVQADDLARLSEDYSLVVVASGGRTLNSLFPRLPEHSPYEQPQRLIVAGYFDGVDLGKGHFNFGIIPGHGEIFQGTSHSFGEDVAQFLIEGIYGQAFQPLADIKYRENPEAFKGAMLDILQAFMPHVYERIDVKRFAPRRPLDLAQGAVTPTVRRAYTRLANGRSVLALGDAHVINDPTVGQGANTGIASAWILGEAILAQDTFDHAFCEAMDAAMWESAQYPTMWANAALQPPPQHMIDLLVASAQNPAVGTAFVDNFGTPKVMWDTISDPANTAAFIQQHMVVPA